MGKVIGMDGKVISNDDPTIVEKENEYIRKYRQLIEAYNLLLKTSISLSNDKSTAAVIEKAEIDMANILHEINKNLLDFYIIQMVRSKANLDSSNDGKKVTDDSVFSLAYLRQLTLFMTLSYSLPQFDVVKATERKEYDKMIDISRRNIIKLIKKDE
jgi:hypothetical protein